MESEKIYRLNLHETCVVNDDADNHCCAIRVPGGWMYFDKYSHISTFVPFDNEFQNK